MLDNGLVRVAFNDAGLLVSFVFEGREIVAEGEVGALLQVFRDIPNRWDAWDIDAHYQRHVTELRQADAVTAEADAIVVRRSYRDSSFVQAFRLAEGATRLDIETRADWHETQKLLKLSFPLAVHADRATSEIQFGHVHRPTHANTSWDSARFETVAHRWVHVGEPGFGVVVANDSTYGHDITRRWTAAGTAYTQVRQSLLRAPRYPDPHADQGVHVLRSAVGPAPTVLEALAAGYQLNLPTRTIPGGAAVPPLLTVSSPSLVVEAVKLAEDKSGDLVVRLYEARGSRATARIDVSEPYARAWTTDLLERPPTGPPVQTSTWSSDEPIEIAFRPFEIVTLRLAAR